MGIAQTAQGYADESTWSRGQAWAIYGYTVCYRETHDKKYLNQALKTFQFMKTHPRLPKESYFLLGYGCSQYSQ